MPNPSELAERFRLDLPKWPKGRLPTIRILSIQYGTSTRTVQLALDYLKKSRLIESRPRSGLWRTGDLPQPSTQIAKVHATDLLTRLTEELLAGAHPWDSPLPLLKELATTWNCHVQTASKILDQAVSLNLLEKRGRYHYPKLPSKSKHKLTPTVLCLGAGAADGHFRMDTDRESDFWRELGAQASMAGLSLVRSVWEGGRIKPTSQVLGVIATTWHYHDPMAICKEVSKLKLPACVWFDEHLLDAPSIDSKVHYHDQGYSEENGATLVRHLIDLGHRNIAFITPWHANPWSQNRYRGIEDEVKRIGGQIHLCSLNGDSEWDRLVPAYSDPTFINEFPVSIIQKIIEGSSDRVRDIMVNELGWNRIRKDMEPLFEQAFASGATAWIGANDICALNALKWLREKNIPVPAQISIAGFDDTIEALRSDLTSFRFSNSSVARSMIYQILSSSRASTLTRHKGMVVARGSTARVKGR